MSLPLAGIEPDTAEKPSVPLTQSLEDAPLRLLAVLDGRSERRVVLGDEGAGGDGGPRRRQQQDILLADGGRAPAAPRVAPPAHVDVPAKET